ncbi:MAG: hypothetical protein HGB37_01210 [Candidatus Moranbacteria bacterium]|nr:hypothetical protein [Candidatus Moranbacteria bacterium]NTW89517.1 hypothetical protein [Candidatus Moranbacteria bacterium]
MPKHDTSKADSTSPESTNTVLEQAINTVVNELGLEGRELGSILRSAATFVGKESKPIDEELTSRLDIKGMRPMTPFERALVELMELQSKTETSTVADQIKKQLFIGCLVESASAPNVSVGENSGASDSLKSLGSIMILSQYNLIKVKEECQCISCQLKRELSQTFAGIEGVEVVGVSGSGNILDFLARMPGFRVKR